MNCYLLRKLAFVENFPLKEREEVPQKGRSESPRIRGFSRDNGSEVTPRIIISRIIILSFSGSLLF